MKNQTLKTEKGRLLKELALEVVKDVIVDQFCQVIIPNVWPAVVWLSCQPLIVHIGIALAIALLVIWWDEARKRARNPSEIHDENL